jgi:NAD+ synthase
MESEQLKSAFCDHLRKSLKTIHRDGFVVGLSGGIDSTVSAHLAVEAVGKDRVFGVIMPERESSPESRQLGMDVAKQLGIRHEEVDITAQLDAFGAYVKRDDIVKGYFPEYDPRQHKVGISLRQNMTGSTMPPLHYLIVQDEAGEQVFEERLRRREYTALVAATNFKQRTRAAQLYYFADRENFAVLGTTNRDELLLGFFVKLGDGAADVEAINVLYKSELFRFAKDIGVDQRIIERTPTTDTLPAQKSQRGYFYGLEFETLDAGLAAMEGVMSKREAASRSRLSEDEVSRLIANLNRRNETTTILRCDPMSLSRDSVAAMIGSA